MKVMGPQFGEIAYICGVNEANKVKSDAQIAKDKNSDSVQNFSLGCTWLGRTVPQLKFFWTSGIIQNKSSYEADIRAAGSYNINI